MIVALASCLGTVPFHNEAPRLLTVNGHQSWTGEYDSHAGYTLDVEPGQEVELVLEVDDPERDEVLVWFPYAPGELVFDPEDRRGWWTVPDPVPRVLLVVLEDDRDPPARADYDIPMWIETGDTGVAD